MGEYGQKALQEVVAGSVCPAAAPDRALACNSSAGGSTDVQQNELHGMGAEWGDGWGALCQRMMLQLSLEGRERGKKIYNRGCGPTHDGDFGEGCQDHRSSAMAIFNPSHACTHFIQKGLAQEDTRGFSVREGPPLSAMSCSRTSRIPAEWSNSDQLSRTWHSSRLSQGECDSSLRQSRALHPLGVWKPWSRLPGSMLGVRAGQQGAYCLPGSIH